MQKKTSLQLQVGTKIFLQNNHGQFLILKRAKPYPGEKMCRWDIPGGRIILGETQQEALMREVIEETSLQAIEILDVLTVQDIIRVKGKHIIRVTYLGKCQEGSVVVNPIEHTDYRWVTLKELQNMHHDQLLTPVINMLQKNHT